MTLPPVSFSINGATASHIVFVTFAPIASPTSIISSTINIEPISVEISLKVTSFTPLFIFDNVLLFELASSRISLEASVSFLIDDCMSASTT